MRLDLFLKVSRLCPRRPIAQKLCDAGIVSVNCRPAKSAHIVKAGDEISIQYRNRLLVFRIAAIPSKRSISKSESATLYQIIKDEKLADYD